MSNLFVKRSLDEVRFWSRTIKEHAFFLRLGFTVDQVKLVQEVDRYYYLFQKFEDRTEQLNDRCKPELMIRTNMEVYHTTSQMWEFNREILGLILSGKIICHTYPLVIDHFSREAAYFMNRLEQLNKGTFAPLPDAIINENIFFLRLMADHAKFISHLLDPSERDLVIQAGEFSYQFDQLLYQTVDLESMRPHSQNVPMLVQLLDENKSYVVTFRNFKKDLREAITSRKIRSIIHPMLADHMYRESEHFLYVLDHFKHSLLNSDESEIIEESSSSSQ
ncbi:DUF2935 domain-containing protein [Aneurinibacillus terranovensis]|uniref:DUF2935 domain-containing protein n=1 Tax=Aneurinibacillus terranovensis TaxID=278991 RepID=UPI00040D4E8B|nr:DUF2935 domain-containing protein [Aneurinibacillus terranovensis]